MNLVRKQNPESRMEKRLKRLSVPQLVYKEIPESDKKQVFALIDTVLGSLDKKEYFIPYSDEELKQLFDKENYAHLWGAYDKDKLVGMAQLYVSQDMLADFKRDFGLPEKCRVCELGGNLVLPEYKKYGVTPILQKKQLLLAKALNFDYVVSMAHPDLLHSLKKVGLNYVKKTVVSGGFPRKLYSKKLQKNR